MFRLRRELYSHLKLDDRMIDLLAVIRVAGDILHELGLPKVGLDPVAVLGESSETLRRENDADLQALDVLRNYLAGWRTRENLEPTSTKQRIAAQSPSPEDAAGHLSHKLGLTKNQAQAAIKRLTEEGDRFVGELALLQSQMHWTLLDRSRATDPSARLLFLSAANRDGEWDNSFV